VILFTAYKRHNKFKDIGRVMGSEMSLKINRRNKKSTLKKTMNNEQGTMYGSWTT
jgi:hypothetical protein